jgi:hypothetical protein
MTTLVNQYILEAKYLDSIKRCKRKSIVGVYSTLEKIEQVKQKLISEEPKYTLAFSINGQFNPFLEKVA